MLAEQQYLRAPLRPFELDSHNNNLTLEEKALLAARSQLFLRAAAAAGAAGAAGSGAPSYAPLLPTVPTLPALPALYGLPPALWGQWACLAAHHLPRPLYPPPLPAAAALRYAPYPPRRASPAPAQPPSPSSEPDREPPPHSPT